MICISRDLARILDPGNLDNAEIHGVSCQNSARHPWADDVILRSAGSGRTLKSRANFWGGPTPLLPLPPGTMSPIPSRRAPIGRVKTVVGSRPKTVERVNRLFPDLCCLCAKARCFVRVSKKPVCVGSAGSAPKWFGESNCRDSFRDFGALLLASLRWTFWRCVLAPLPPPSPLCWRAWPGVQPYQPLDPTCVMT